MAAKRLVWDLESTRRYETGVSNGVFYPLTKDAEYTPGVVWNGLTSVSENPSGGDASAQYADNIKYLNLRAAEEYGFTIEAFTYPPEFSECDGSAEVATGVRIGQQIRKKFGFCYKTIIGNDTEGESYGYKLHLAYGCEAAPSSRQYDSVNDSPNAITFSWEISTNPVNVTGYKPTAILEIDSTTTDSDKLKALEDILYGKDPVGDDTDGVAPRLPLPNEVITLVGSVG